MKLKMIAAALVLAAAGSAHAAMDKSTSGNGSLVLGVIDYSAGVSATFDLGVNIDGFQPGTTAYTQWDLTSGDYADAWTGFATASGAGISNAKYVVFAMDSTGTAAGEDRFLSTTLADMTITTNKPTNSQLINFNQVDGHLNALNIDATLNLGNHDTVENGGAFAMSSATTNGYLGASNAFGNTGKWAVSQSPFVAIGNIDNALAFYSIATSSTSGLARATVVAYEDFAQDFYLSSTGTLTYGVATVPEAETYALMLAGLGMVGFMARRRKAA